MSPRGPLTWWLLAVEVTEKVGRQDQIQENVLSLCHNSKNPISYYVNIILGLLVVLLVSGVWECVHVWVWRRNHLCHFYPHVPNHIRTVYDFLIFLCHKFILQGGELCNQGSFVQKIHLEHFVLQTLSMGHRNTGDFLKLRAKNLIYFNFIQFLKSGVRRPGMM